MFDFDPWYRTEVIDGVATPKGPAHRMLLELSASLKFNYEIIHPKENLLWGNKLPNGSWTGWIGLIHRGEADFTVMPSGFTLDRITDFYAARDYHTSYSTILAGGSQEVPKNLFGYFMTFGMEVWVCLMISMMLIIALSTFVDWSENRHLSKSSSIKETISKNFWNYLAALFNEATPRSSNSNLNRFLLAVWLMSMLILINGFTGTFKASLTMVSESTRIDSVEDLANRKDVHILTWKGGVLENLIRTSENKAVRKVAQRIFKENGLVSLKTLYGEEVLKKINTGNVVILTEMSSVKSTLANICSSLNLGSIYLSKEAVDPMPFFLILKKTLPDKFKRAINRRLQLYVEGEFITKWLDEMYGGWKLCGRAEEHTEKNLSFEDLRAVFILWLLSLFLAIIVFIVEILTEQTLCQRAKKETIVNN